MADQRGGGDNVGTVRFVQLSLLPESFGAVYREGLHPEILHWIYPDEPIVVQVTLSNRSGESIDLPRQPREWFEAAPIQLIEKVPGQKTEAASSAPARELSGRLLQRSRVGPTSLTSGLLRLGTGSSETVRLEFDRTESFDVRPGIYALSVSIVRRFAVAESVNQLLHSERLVGVRAIESRADMMNHASHMAIWATFAKDFNAARRWLRELLVVNPVSTVAYTQMGNVAEAQGLCKEAIANWEKALQLLTANSDTEARELGTSGREDSLSSLKRKIGRCR
jgi:tetratricopeptide (TPR) repeat protein